MIRVSSHRIWNEVFLRKNTWRWMGPSTKRYVICFGKNNLCIKCRSKFHIWRFWCFFWKILSPIIDDIYVSKMFLCMFFVIFCPKGSPGIFVFSNSKSTNTIHNLHSESFLLYQDSIICWFELENNHLRTRPFLRFEAFLSLACLPFPQDVFLSIHLTIILPLKLSFADNVTTLFQLNLDVFHYLYKLVFQISDPCELHIFFQSLFLWVIGKSTSPHMKEKRWCHLKLWKRHPERRSC